MHQIGQRDQVKNPRKSSNLRGFQVVLVPAIGFELMTYRLQGGCSTN